MRRLFHLNKQEEYLYEKRNISATQHTTQEETGISCPFKLTDRTPHLA